MTRKQRQPKYNKDGTIFYRACFYMNEQDNEMFEFLREVYGLNGAALVRHLITEVYSIIKHVENK